MRRRDATVLTPEIERELRAIDATLAGHPVDAGHDELVELSRALVAQRPAPRAAFAAELDSRVERGFRRAPSSGKSRGRLHWPVLGAVGALGAAGVAVAVALSVGGSSGGSASSGSSASASKGAGGATAGVAAPSVVGRSRRRVTPSDAFGAAAPSTGLPNALRPARRKVGRSARVGLATAPDRIDAVARRVVAVTQAAGGIVQRSSVSTGAGRHAGASFALSIPSRRFERTVDRLSRLGRLRSRTESGLDVTGRFDSTRQRVSELQATRRGLLRQLAAATATAQSDALRRRLRAIDAQLAYAHRALAGLRQRADFGTVSLSIRPGHETKAGGAGRSGGFTLGGALHAAARVLAVGLGVVVVALAGLVPLGALLAMALAAARVLRRRQRDQALEAG